MSDWSHTQKPRTQVIKPGISQAELFRSRQQTVEDSLTEGLLGTRGSRRKLFEIFPDEGKFNRHLYPKQMEGFGATKDYDEVAFIAANRVGKTTAAAYCGACFATGWYPKWWPGRVFRGPTRGWACGKSGKKVRELVQTELFGDPVVISGEKTVTGTGMIPKEWIGRCTWQQGVPDYIDTVKVLNRSGKWSEIALKSYEQGRDAMEGDKRDWIWDDEEPPEEVYGEQILRLTPTVGIGGRSGVMLCTFTPLEGLTNVVLSYWDPSQLNKPEGRDT